MCLALSVARQLEAMPHLRQVQFKLDEGTAKQCGLETPPEQIEVELVLIDDPEHLDHWNAPENSLGLFAMSSGAFEDQDQDFLSAKHRVVVQINPEQLREQILYRRTEERDPQSTRYDCVSIADYLTTITHELTHCLDFISHANGATPSQAASLMEEDLLDLNLLDLVSGHGVLFPFNEDLSEIELSDLMEERVEEAGRDLMEKIELDHQTLQAALRLYAPRRAQPEASPSP